MAGQIALHAAAIKGSLKGKFVRVSYMCSRTKQSKERFGQVIAIGNGPMGNNVTLDTPEGCRTLPLPNMETSARFMTEQEFRKMFPEWKPYEPK